MSVRKMSCSGVLSISAGTFRPSPIRRSASSALGWSVRPAPSGWMAAARS